MSVLTACHAVDNYQAQHIINVMHERGYGPNYQLVFDSPRNPPFKLTRLMVLPSGYEINYTLPGVIDDPAQYVVAEYIQGSELSVMNQWLMILKEFQGYNCQHVEYKVHHQSKTHLYYTANISQCENITHPLYISEQIIVQMDGLYLLQYTALLDRVSVRDCDLANKMIARARIKPYQLELS